MRVLSALLSAAALLPLLTRAAFHSNDTACTRHYTVEAGDTCDKIGQKTLTSTYQILAFNLLDAGADCYTLEIGSKLCLGRYGNDCQFVHQCTNQDTCESIANNYGITTSRLQSNNPSLDCDVVYDGLMLCVSAGSIRPPADASINATDVKAAREEARQMWLAKQPVEDVQPASRHKGKHHAHSSANSKKHGSHSEAKKQHHHHKHASDRGAKSHKPHAHHTAAAASASAPPQQQRAVEVEVEVESSSSFHVEARSSSSSSKSSSTEELFVDDLLTSSAASFGSNHTPHQQDRRATPHRRHRSLSSRSHHQQRSHTP